VFVLKQKSTQKVFGSFEKEGKIYAVIIIIVVVFSQSFPNNYIFNINSFIKLNSRNSIFIFK